MTQEDAFLQDIIANPEDDALRLIYADWLDEQDQSERAEFIRLQIELVRLPLHDPRRKEMAKREKTLLRKHATKWFAPPKGLKVGSQFEVRRGFPFELNISEHGFDALGAELLARWPITRVSLKLWDPPDAADNLAACSLLRQVRELDLGSNNLGQDQQYRVLESPHLVNLKWLGLGHNDLKDEGMRFLAQLPHLAGVRDLDLRHNNITSLGLSELTRSKHHRALTALILSGNQHTADDVVALLESKNWPALSDLNLWYTSLGDEGVELLAASRGLAKLTVLNLNNNSIGDRGVQALGASPHAANLRTLALDINRITAASVPALIESPYLKQLTSLTLYSNDGIKVRARRELSEHFGDRVTFQKPW
jgi:uncharacterized protein (TIGR02996 family)